MGRRICVVFNPAAGQWRQRKLRWVMKELGRLGCGAELRETEARGHAEVIARDAAREGFDVVAAAGGDGTACEVANGLSEDGPALGIIPFGTANVLAYETGQGVRLGSAVRALAKGRIRKVRAGRAGERRFVLFAGAGLDAHVVDRVHLGLKRRTAHFAFVVEAARQALRYRFPPLRVSVDGDEHEAALAIVLNGARYAGPFRAAPEASLREPGFHVCLPKRKGLWNIIRYGYGLVTGRLGRLKDVEFLKGRHVSIRCRSRVPVHTDGDVTTHLPVEIIVDPEPIRLVYPLSPRKA